MNLSLDDMVTERLLATLVKLKFQSAIPVEIDFIMARLYEAVNAPGYIPEDEYEDVPFYENEFLRVWKPIK